MNFYNKFYLLLLVLLVCLQFIDEIYCKKSYSTRRRSKNRVEEPTYELYCKLVTEDKQSLQAPICGYRILEGNLEMTCQSKGSMDTSNMPVCESKNITDSSICGIRLKLKYPMISGFLPSLSSIGQKTCQTQINLTISYADDKSERMANMQDFDFHHLIFEKASRWSVVNKFLKSFPNIRELTISGIIGKDKLKYIINTEHLARLELLRIANSSASALSPEMIVIHEQSKLKRLELINLSTKQISSEAITIRNCEQHEILLDSENELGLLIANMNQDFIVKEACKSKKTTMILELRGRSFNHELAPDIHQTILKLAHVNDQFYLKIDSIDCCRRAEWIYSLMDEDKNRTKYYIEADCFDLLNHVNDYNSSAEIRDSCTKRDVDPLLTIAVISILLLAILLATFSFACLFYVIPRKGKIVVINDPRAKEPAKKGGFQYSMNPGKQETTGIVQQKAKTLVVKTVDTDLESRAPIMSFGKSKASKHSRTSIISDPSEPTVAKNSKGSRRSSSNRSDKHKPKAKTKHDSKVKPIKGKKGSNGSLMGASTTRSKL